MVPLVSINCITYNHEKTVGIAIESFLMQKTNFPYEIIIGEDCSTDRTREVIKNYIQKYPEKITLITSDKNVGAMQNELRVHYKSRGKYIAVCEGDDYWTDPYKLQKQVDYMEGHPECSLHIHAAEVIHYNQKKRREISRPADCDSIFTIKDMIENEGNFITTSTMFYRRKLVDPLPSFYPDCSVGDYPLTMILAHQGYIFYKNEVMSTYRYSYKGSWSERNMHGRNYRNKTIEKNKSDIFILESFNEYSNFKYNQLISEQIATRKADIAILEKDFSVFNTYFKNQKRSKKLKLRVFAYFPSLYNKLLDIKGFIFNRI